MLIFATAQSVLYPSVDGLGLWFTAGHCDTDVASPTCSRSHPASQFPYTSQFSTPLARSVNKNGHELQWSTCRGSGQMFCFRSLHSDYDSTFNNQSICSHVILRKCYSWRLPRLLLQGKKRKKTFLWNCCLSPLNLSNLTNLFWLTDCLVYRFSVFKWLLIASIT